MGGSSESGGASIDVFAGQSASSRRTLHDGPRRRPAGSSGSRPDGTWGTIGRYLVLQTLGAGRSGVVHAAYDPHLDRKVAIKRLRDRSARAQPAALREALATARLVHPNVVAVHEVDVDEHGVYIVMEFVRGESLRGWLAAAPRTTAEILAVFIQAGHGLAAAHAAGILHRDFKPDSVLVDRDGRVRVGDFGLARAPLVEELTETEELTGLQLGTRSSGARGAPASNDGPADTPATLATGVQADIYSFCRALHDALHGHRPPAPGDRPHAGPAPRKVPAWLLAVVDRGLRIDPERRWPTVAALLRALTSDPHEARRRGLRTVAGAALGALLIAAGILGGSRVVASWDHARAEERAAARLAEIEAIAHTPAGAAALAAFIADEDHHGTAALALAHLHRGDRSAAAGDATAALADHATAYMRATTPATTEAALRSIARGLRDTWSARPLALALDELTATTSVDPELAALRVDQALLAADVIGAAEALPDGDPRRPVLTALTRGGPTGKIADAPRLTEFAGRPAISACWRDRLDIFEATPALAQLASYTAPVSLDRPLARAGWAISADAGRLHVLDLTRPDPVRLQAAFAGDLVTAGEADLDADGAIDLYLGPGGDRPGFLVIRDVYGDPRPPVPAHAATHQTDAALESLLLADLGGDPRPELLAGFGASTAFDLRAFRAGSDHDDLTLLVRTTLGRPAGIARLLLPTGRHLAVATDEQHPAPDLFPAPPHVAAPASLHLLRADLSLAETSALPLPRRPGGRAFALTDGPLVGDLDGDGRDDMLLGAADPAPTALLYVQRPDGSFAATTLVGLRPRLLVDLDADGDPDLLASDRDHQLWVLGAGDRPLPRPRALPPTRAPAPPLDPPLAARWHKAEVLAALGLAGPAARDLADMARLAPEPLRPQLLGRAAEHAALAGDDPLVVTLSERLFTAQAHRAAALARAAEALVRLGRFTDAGHLVEALAAEPDPQSGPAATRKALGDLAHLARNDLRTRLDFRHPLTGWRIDRPEAVRRAAATDELLLEPVGADERLLSVPLLWTGGPLAVELELELADLERGQELRVTLVDDEGRPWIGGGSGGSDDDDPLAQRLTGTGWARPWDTLATLPAAPRKLRVRLGLLPRTRQGVRVFESDGHLVRDSFELMAAPTPGRYHLVFGTASAAPTRLAARVRDLTVHGALLDPAIPADTPHVAAARGLTDGDPAAALAALARDPACTPESSLLEAFALAELGDLDGARAAFSAVLATGDPDLLARVHHALRRGPAVALAVRAALGPELLTLAHAVWTPILRRHADLPDTLARARESLAGLELVAPRTPAQARALADLLALRGVLAADAGDLQRAELDLRAGLQRDPSDRVAADATHALVRLHLDDPARALATTRDALANSRDPDALRLRLRSDPALAPLHRDPRWQALVADPYAPKLTP